MAAPQPPAPVLELRVALTTDDYEGLLRFYRDGLGLGPPQVWANGAGRAAVFGLGEATLEIFDEAQAATIDGIEAGARVSGTIRFALQVPDLASALERLRANGAILVHPPVITPWGHHNVRVQDPTGMQITLFQVLGEADRG